jgi:hypothetical protein
VLSFMGLMTNAASFWNPIFSSTTLCVEFSRMKSWYRKDSDVPRHKIFTDPFQGITKPGKTHIVGMGKSPGRKQNRLRWFHADSSSSLLSVVVVGHKCK